MLSVWTIEPGGRTVGGRVGGLVRVSRWRAWFTDRVVSFRSSVSGHLESRDVSVLGRGIR